MLDRSKLIAQLQQAADMLFVDVAPSYKYAQNAWQSIIQDPLFLYKVREVKNAPWPVPLWEGNLGDVIPVKKVDAAHTVLSVDGSQIYPDRHNILSCFLINIGSVVLPYLCAHKRVQLYSDPTVFAGVDENKMPYTTDTVNCKRQELELRAGLDLGKKIKAENSGDALSLLLFDGSLIFWHLSSKEIELRDHFLNAYLSLLDELYQEKTLVAWYISMPKSKELISLVRLYLSDFNPSKKEKYEHIDDVIDSGIMQSFLQPHTRTIVFRNCSSISDYYPSHLRPYFFYVHTGTEIGRVELPFWMAHNEQIVDTVASIVIDQCIKGAGYPVALAEAHEQAVVKGPDRDFFYHFLQKMSIERNRTISVSQKSLKKRGLGI